MDKLSMEEAGYCNCVSVPDGAPPKVSDKELPDKEEVLIHLKGLNILTLQLTFNLQSYLFIYIYFLVFIVWWLPKSLSLSLINS